MKQPKLKNYFVAVPPDLYVEFERTRRLPTIPTTLDLTTGRAVGRPYWYLAAQPNIADNLVREQYRYGGPVYILRVPSSCLDRDQLKLVEGAQQIWQYGQDIEIPGHCAVYKYEVDR